MKKFLYLCLAGTIVSGSIVLYSQTAFGAKDTTVNRVVDGVINAGVKAARGKTDAAERQLESTASRTLQQTMRKGTQELKAGINSALGGNNKKATSTRKTQRSSTGSVGSGTGTPSSRGTGTPTTSTPKTTTTTTGTSGTTTVTPTGRVVTGTDADVTHWYQPFNKAADSVYQVGDTVTVQNPNLGKMTGVVTKVTGDEVTLDYGGSHSTFQTGHTGHVVESTGQNYAHGMDIKTTDTYGIGDISKMAGTGRTNVTTGADGLRTIETQNGTFREVSKGVFEQVDGNAFTATTTNNGSFYTDSELLTKYWNTTDDPFQTGGLFESIKDPTTSAIFDGDVAYLRTDGGWGQVSVGDYVSFKGEVDGNLMPADVNGADYQIVSFNEDGTFTVADMDGNTATVRAAEIKPSEIKNAKQEAEAPGKQQEAESKVQEAQALETANTTNAIQYAILIMQANEANRQEDATKTVTVGAEDLQATQGEPTGSGIGGATTLDGTTLSCGANGLAYLLQANPVDISLMDMSDYDPSSTSDRISIQNRRNQLLQQYALSAEIIAEGSNIISSRFYNRVQGIAGQSGTVTGTLGAMSVLNDTERYPYFEMVRQMALSGVQLGLKGAETLGHIDIVKLEDEEGDTDDDEPGNENPGSGNENPGSGNENPGSGNENPSNPESGNNNGNNAGAVVNDPNNLLAAARGLDAVAYGDSENSGSGNNNSNNNNSTSDDENHESDDENNETDEQNDENSDNSEEEQTAPPQVVKVTAGTPTTVRTALPGSGTIN